MLRYILLALVLIMAGCKVNFDKSDPAKPVDPIIITPQDIDNSKLSESLARLAERCTKSEIRKATVELDGTLNELVADGISKTYTDAVRKAVPAIGSKPARDLTEDEIKILKEVK